VSKKNPVSQRTRTNWLVATAVFGGAFVSAVTGVYFLYLPSGGYMGGRNPWYGVTILFDRHTWDDLHTWGGVAMIAAVVIHLALHWNWVEAMARRMAKAARGQAGRMSTRGRLNLAVDAVIALSFLVCALSGLYFLFTPSGSGAELAAPRILFSRTAWDMLHTWSAVVLMIAAGFHIAIHWKWIVKVGANLFAQLRRPAQREESAPALRRSPTG